MNQLAEWTGKCQRCFNKSDMYTMSMFDVALICMDCKDAEARHPRYKEAQEAEINALRGGDRNFKGIGWREEE